MVHALVQHHAAHEGADVEVSKASAGLRYVIGRSRPGGWAAGRRAWLLPGAGGVDVGDAADRHPLPGLGPGLRVRGAPRLGGGPGQRGGCVRAPGGRGVGGGLAGSLLDRDRGAGVGVGVGRRRGRGAPVGAEPASDVAGALALASAVTEAAGDASPAP
jgi:hypothetical protein